jgi:hypothetical protein
MSVSRYITRAQWRVQQRAYDIVASHNTYIEEISKDFNRVLVGGSAAIVLGYFAVMSGGADGLPLASVAALGWAGFHGHSLRKTMRFLGSAPPFHRLYKKPRSPVELKFPLYQDAWENLTERLPSPPTTENVEEEALKLIAAVNDGIEL